jgi:hypothetical protein
LIAASGRDRPLIPRARSAIAAVAFLAVAGCGTGPGPSGGLTSPTTALPDASGGPGPSAVVGDLLAGPWRATPIAVDDAHVAIASDACAAKARTDLGETDANLPTALVDARGKGFVTVIMADDLDAIECLARLDAAGTTATVDSVDGLSMTAVAPVDGSAITVASVVTEAGGSGGRTVAFGRIGSDTATTRIRLADGSSVVASNSAGWWAAWWAGTVRASGYAAVEGDLVVGTATPPADELEARIGPASWWLDPAAAAPTATSTTIHALVLEQACVGGKSPKGRVEPPLIDLEDTAVTITFAIRRLAGEGGCIANVPFPVAITLPEPLGNRTLFDGGGVAPRNANSMPSN